MFICEPCHNKSACNMGLIEGFMRSRGPCEQCGTVANCLDCHGYKNLPLPAEEQAELDRILSEDSRIDPNPGGEDYPWPVDNPPLGQGNDYVTCGALLSMHHPLRRKTGMRECLCLIPMLELPKACPQCGQWKS